MNEAELREALAAHRMVSGSNRGVDCRCGWLGPGSDHEAHVAHELADLDCEHHSWVGLMSLLDEHWPEDIFPTREDDLRRDAGARIVSLIRWVDRLRAEVSA